MGLNGPGGTTTASGLSNTPTAVGTLSNATDGVKVGSSFSCTNLPWVHTVSRFINCRMSAAAPSLDRWLRAPAGCAGANHVRILREQCERRTDGGEHFRPCPGAAWAERQPRTGVSATALAGTGANHAMASHSANPINTAVAPPKNRNGCICSVSCQTRNRP